MLDRDSTLFLVTLPDTGDDVLPDRLLDVLWEKFPGHVFTWELRRGAAQAVEVQPADAKLAGRVLEEVHMFLAVGQSASATRH